MVGISKTYINKETNIRLLVALVLVILTVPPLVEAAPINNEDLDVQTEQVVVQTDLPQVEVPTERIVESKPVSQQVKKDKESTSCATELKKYDWNHTVAHNVMMVESTNNHLAVNDNPSTGDYSIGCFQINLYGNLKDTRPSESWLKNPVNNVKYAYEMYQSQGWTPWSYTTCKKVACY